MRRPAKDDDVPHGEEERVVVERAAVKGSVPGRLVSAVCGAECFLLEEKQEQRRFPGTVAEAGLV